MCPLDAINNIDTQQNNHPFTLLVAEFFVELVSHFHTAAQNAGHGAACQRINLNSAMRWLVSISNALPVSPAPSET
jgi:hypothetical protein